MFMQSFQKRCGKKESMEGPRSVTLTQVPNE